MTQRDTKKRKRPARGANSVLFQDRGPILTGVQAGLLFGFSGERISQLVAAGFIKPAESGGYRLLDVTQGYRAFRDDEDRRSSKSAAASRISDARAREIELRLLEREGMVVPRTDLVDCADDLIGSLRSFLSGLGAQVTRDLKLRRTIDAAIRDKLQQLHSVAVEKANLLGAGRAASGTDAGTAS